MRYVLSFFLFQLQWFLCVLNIKHSYLLALGIFFVEIIFLVINKNTDKKYLKIVLVFLLPLIGILCDSVLKYIGVLVFSGFQEQWLIPGWLMTLWFCFSLWYVKADFINQDLKKYTLLCLIFGPLSYYSGMKLGALGFGMSLWFSLIIMALYWFLLGVLFVKINISLIKKAEKI